MIRTSLLLLLFVLVKAPLLAQKQTYQLKTKGLIVYVSKMGSIKKIELGKRKIEKPLNAFTTIQGYHVKGKISIRNTDGGGIEFKKQLVNDALSSSCTLIEKFTPLNNSIRWTFTITGNGKEQDGIFKSTFNYPLKSTTRFWTAWGGPQYSKTNTNNELIKRLSPNNRPVLKDKVKEWHDPLVPMPFCQAEIYYGAPYFSNDTPRIHCNPYNENITAIPMCSILDEEEGSGVTIALSPRDNIIDMVLNTDERGTISFSRIHNRIPVNRSFSYTLDIIAGEDDWRGGLGWMQDHYPEYFFPKTKNALRFAGTGAYASPFKDFDENKLKKMAFSVNWQASYDFPYMGMFLPPLAKDKEWNRLDKGKMSVNGMNNYAADMARKGFYVFNYFNVTEFGVNILPDTAVKLKSETPNDWQNANLFLYHHFPDAILQVPQKINTAGWPKIKPGGLYYSWKNSVAMDCGDSKYQQFLLQQAYRHATQIPSSYGICIDRMDWLRMFNENADDNISWLNGKPARSLITSWKSLMARLEPMMHREEKSILVNNHTKRIDLLKNVDGFFDEFTYAGAALNTTALLAVSKPAMGWTDSASTIKNEGGDLFFQKYLYMGVFPMAPHPGNNHPYAILPNAYVDSLYLAYGPLMNVMKGRAWVLKPHVIKVKDNVAKANFFKVPQGYAIPIVYPLAGITAVELQFKPDRLKKINSCWAYYPGQRPQAIKFKKDGDVIKVTVPLKSACAMLLVKAG